MAVYTLSAAQCKSLAALPRATERYIEGGIGTVKGNLIEYGGMTAIQVAIWLDGETELVRSVQLTFPEKGRNPQHDALEALVKAIIGPFAFTNGPEHLAQIGIDLLPPPDIRPELPTVIRINDAALADAARDLLRDYDLTIEHAPELPKFKDAYEDFARSLHLMREDEEEMEAAPFAWEIDPTYLAPLYKAAAAFWRAKLWEVLPDQPPLMVEAGASPFYVSIMGGGGMEFGAVLARSIEAFETAINRSEQMMDVDPDTRQAILNAMTIAGVPLDTLPPDELEAMIADVAMAGDPSSVGQAWANTLSLSFDPQDETDPTYLEWLKAQGLSYSSKRGVPIFMKLDEAGDIGLPDEADARILALSLTALAQFFKRHRSTIATAALAAGQLSDEFSIADPAGGSKQTVRVTFPPPGYEWQPQPITAPEDLFAQIQQFLGDQNR